MRTVDLVVSGGDSAAGPVALDALRRGRRVLVVLRSNDARVAQRLRRWLRRCANVAAGQLWIVSDAEVVCVDGIDAVEAVVIRYARTGRLCAVNASAFAPVLR